VFQFADEIYKINSGNLPSESKFKALLAERFFSAGTLHKNISAFQATKTAEIF
jgi:hypothetical protein